jgi:sulfur carrier protein ThiS
MESPMGIRLMPVGLLKSYCRDLIDPEGGIPLENREGDTLETACRDIGLPVKMISLFLVNGRPQDRTYRLRAGDRVKCVALIGGG